MKKRTVKPPVDDLFARKLENMSLPPNPDGFARLQARMGRTEPSVQYVFWRNPTNQRYMAVAACLLMVCLFGGLYLLTEAPVSEQRATAPINKLRPSPIPKQVEWKSTANQEQVAAIRPSPKRKMNARISPQPTGRRSGNFDKPVVSKVVTDNRRLAAINPAAHGKQLMSQNTPTMIPDGPATKPIINTPPAGPTPGPQLSATTIKPAPTAERVLVVTIAEPEGLVAAHQAVKQSTESKGIAAVADKPDKESKATTLWQQVKRVKQVYSVVPSTV